MDPTIIQGIAGIYWFFDPRRVTEHRIALIFDITEDEVRSIKESSAYLDTIENLMRTTRSPAEFVKWVNMEEVSQISERLGERMGIDPSLIQDMIQQVRQAHYAQDLDRGTTIDDIINEIKGKSNGGNYIYRGEPRMYEKVSSALYREYAKSFNLDQFNLMGAQGEMLKIAKNHIGESIVGPLEYFREIAEMNKRHMGDQRRSSARVFGDLSVETTSETITAAINLEILTELQHYGGKTNLIDFTTDYLIAIYFACSGHPKKAGRVILLEKNKAVEDMMVRPQNPRHRIIAQKSVFIQPPQGDIEVPDNKIVSIPANLKQDLLDYLEKFHSISTQSIYNDIHGFIRYQNIHRTAYVQFDMGFMLQKSAREVESLEEKQKIYKKVVEHYDEAINLNPDIGSQIHCNLVLCHRLSDGYNLLSLMRASRVLNRHLTVARCSFLRSCHA